MSIETSPQPPFPSPEPPETKSELIPKLYVGLGIIVTVVIIGLLIGGTIWLVSDPERAASIAALRDIFIIALALASCLSGIVMIIMLMMMVRLVNMLEFEIKPILEKTNETVGMVRGTTVFVSDNVVKPVTTASSYITGLRQGIKTLFGDPRKNLD